MTNFSYLEAGGIFQSALRNRIGVLERLFLHHELSFSWTDSKILTEIATDVFRTNGNPIIVVFAWWCQTDVCLESVQATIWAEAARIHELVGSPMIVHEIHQNAFSLLIQRPRRHSIWNDKSLGLIIVLTRPKQSGHLLQYRTVGRRYHSLRCDQGDRHDRDSEVSLRTFEFSLDVWQHSFDLELVVIYWHDSYGENTSSGWRS